MRWRGNGDLVNDSELEHLFRTYHVPLVRYLTRRLGDRDWAEEVAQETFLRAMRQENLTSERAWLFAVATNLVRDEARKLERRRRHLELLAEEQRDLVVEPDTDTVDRAHERILAALDDVPALRAGGTQMDERPVSDSQSAGVVPLPVGRVARLTRSWQFRRATLIRVAAVLVIAAGTLAITQVMRGPRPLGAPQ